MATLKLTVTDTLKTHLRDAWTGEVEAMGWDQAELDRYLAALDAVPTGTVIYASDEVDRPEENATPEELIALGWEYFGFLPPVATYEWILDDGQVIKP